MGGVVSTGHDNDDLVNNLLHAEYIKTPAVERAFRAVDRADYYLDEARGSAYKDLAWKKGNLHLSAPCIYSEVMEGLVLAPGLSFLNLGSGTGYLSTMAGLILGPYGVNHGIEIHSDVISYANKKLDEFKRYSTALDEFEFCSPKFVKGNCLCLNTEFPQYDRVYCGAACPENHQFYMKNLIKVGGILIMPLNDKLLQIKRTSESSWDETFLLSVSFASLILPPLYSSESVKPLDFEPLSLQEICRSAIRTILRHNIDMEHPDIKRNRQNPPKRPRKKRTLRRMVVPIFEESDLETSDNITDDDERPDRGRARLSSDQFGNHREINSFLNLVLDLGQNCPRTVHNPQAVDELERAVDTENQEMPGDEEIAEASSSDEQKKNTSKREKFDSGLGEELLEKGHSSDSEANCGMELDSDSDDSYVHSAGDRSSSSVLRISSNRLRNLETDSDSDEHTECESQSPRKPSYVSPYTEHMRAKIQALPLPPVLKQYLNLYREF